MSNKKRYAIIMILGILMNEGFHQIASAYALPVWLDLSGTAFVAFVLEPTAGLLVGLVNNFILAAFYYDSSSLVYYSASAAVALIVGLYVKKDGKTTVKRVLVAMCMVIVATTFLSGLITLWRTGGISDSRMERYYYSVAFDMGVPHVLSCFYGIFVLKLYDTIVCTGIIALFYRLMPKTLRDGKKTE